MTEIEMQQAVELARRLTDPKRRETYDMRAAVALARALLARVAEVERLTCELRRRHTDECDHMLGISPGSCNRCEGT